VCGRGVLAEEESKKELPYGVRRAAQDVHNRDGIQKRIPRQDVTMAEVASTLDSTIEVFNIGVPWFDIMLEQSLEVYRGPFTLFEFFFKAGALVSPRSQGGPRRIKTHHRKLPEC